MIYKLSDWQNVIVNSIGEQKYENYRQSVANDDRPIPIRFNVLDEDGNEKWLLMRGGNTVRDEHGNVIRLYGTVSNITEQVNREKELKI